MFRIKPHPLLPIDESLPRGHRIGSSGHNRRQPETVESSGKKKLSRQQRVQLPAGSDSFYLFIGVSIWVLDAAFWCGCIYWIAR